MELSKAPQPAISRMRVAVLVPPQSTGKLPAAAVRLLAELMALPEIDVAVFYTSPCEAEPLSPGTQGLLSLERCLVRQPVRNALPPLPDLRIDPGVVAQNAVWDIVVDMGGGPLDAALAARSNNGIWRIETHPIEAALNGFDFTEATLIRHDDAETRRIIANAVYDTKPLATLNDSYVREKTAQIVLREVKRCARDGAPADLGPAPSASFKPTPYAGGYLVRTAAKSLERLRTQIALRRGQFHKGFRLIKGQGSALDFEPASAKPVPMPAVSLWADPFLIAHEGGVYCFFEEVDVALKRGHISVGRVTDAGIVDVQVAMRQPHHMSYPFVFQRNGMLLMMPEVHGANRLEIWRSTDFPSGWELYATAFEGMPVVDSVLLERDGEWWLFTHISRDTFDDYCSDLHVFRVDGPELTGLVPHRLNPVVTNSATARGGGRIHQADGRMLRFSQDNSRGSYGGALNVMEITRLDLDHYEERRVRHITPDFAPGLSGCHHFDTLDGIFVMDVR